MKGSKFAFVMFIYYITNIRKQIRMGWIIYRFSDWMKNEKASINPINKKDKKSLIRCNSHVKL